MTVYDNYPMWLVNAIGLPLNMLALPLGFLSERWLPYLKTQ